MVFRKNIIKNLRYQQGVTLVEVIMYIAFFALFFIVLIQFYFFLNNQTTQAQVSLILDRNQIFLDQHLSESFESSQNIDLTNTNATLPNPIIELLNQDGTTQIYNFSDNNLTYTNNSDETSDMLARSIAINMNSIEYIQSPQGEVIGISLNFDLIYNDTSRNLSQNYFTQNGI